LAVWITGLVAILILIPSIIKLIVDYCTRSRLGEFQFTLRKQMLERGYTVDEIVKVCGASATDALAGVLESDSPIGEVVVEREEEWHAARILKSRGDVHYVEYENEDEDSREWVDESRIRFPARFAFRQEGSEGGKPASGSGSAFCCGSNASNGQKAAIA